MKLPFKIHDGVKLRECDYDDLLIICELGLEFNVYSKDRSWWIFKVELSPGLVMIIYSMLRSISDIDKLSNRSTVLVNNYRIDRIVCKSLSKYKKSSMIRILIKSGLI